MGSNCDYCGKPSKQHVGAINRARRKGLPLYCDKICSGFARRKNKTTAQKKAEKSAYDRKLRSEHPAALKIRRAVSHKKNYDPEKAAVKRQEHMPRHIEYCRRPEYRAWKHEYDQKYNMERVYGPFWGAARLLTTLEAEIKSRASNYEIDVQNGTINKTLKRKRAYAQTINDQTRDTEIPLGCQPKGSSLGNS